MHICVYKKEYLLKKKKKRVKIMMEALINIALKIKK